MEYANRYPQCAGCTNLKELQERRDDAARNGERHSIDASLDNSIVQYIAEMIGEDFNSKIGEMTANGALDTDESVISMRTMKTHVAETMAKALTIMQECEDQANQDADRQTQEIDDLAFRLVAGCSRALKLRPGNADCSSTESPFK